MNLFLLLEKLHGHIAILGLALCFHPPVALRKARAPGRGTRISAYLASALVTVGMVLGWVIYPEYRREVRQELYLAGDWYGRAFEVKEHIATFTLALVLAGAIVTWLSARPRAGQALTPAIRRIYLTAGLMGVTSAVLGIVLASVNGFPYG